MQIVHQPLRPNVRFQSVKSDALPDLLLSGPCNLASDGLRFGGPPVSTHSTELPTRALWNRGSHFW
jgi:hypothetical protein